MNESIVEKLVTGFKVKIPFLVQNILEKFVDKSLDEENYSVNRLKQIQDNLKDRVQEKDPGLSSESIEGSQIGVVHWCGNADRFMEQEIRRHDQLGGTNQLFEIDPMANLLELDAE